MPLRAALRHPLVYQGFQQAFGFFGARRRAIARHLPLAGGERILDVGCGPGFLAAHLPAGCPYVGLDTDARYIAYAQRRFGDRGRFLCQAYDAATAAALGRFDVVMMNGLLHHLRDGEAHALLALAAAALVPGGHLFALDGCFAPGQSALVRWLLARDRGDQVRDEAGYRALLAAHFDAVAAHRHDRLSWFPYTFLVMVGGAPRASRALSAAPAPAPPGAAAPPAR